MDERRNLNNLQTICLQKVSKVKNSGSCRSHFNMSGNPSKKKAYMASISPINPLQYRENCRDISTAICVAGRSFIPLLIRSC